MNPRNGEVILEGALSAFAENLTAGGPILSLGSDGLTSAHTAGTIHIAGGIIVINDGANTLVFDNIQVGTGVIPEPSVLALLAFGGIVLWRRFRRP